MKVWKHLLVAVTSAGLLAACGGGGSESPSATTSPAASEDRSLAEAARSEPSTSEFMKLAQSTGTSEQLHADGGLTLIAPSNDAMAEMRDEIAELQRPENRDALQAFVESHIVPREMASSDMRSGSETTLAGTTIEVSVDASASTADAVTVNGAPIALADVKARNGRMYVTHKPLFRPGAWWYVKHRSNFSILAQAIDAAGLTDALRTKEPFTLFAPTDAAFGALLAELNVTAEQLLANKPLLVDVLSYHVLRDKLSARRIADGDTPATVQGQAVSFDVQRRAGPDIRVVDARGRAANVVAANLFARKGVVHVIDKVLLPQDRNLVQIAQANADFSILVDAVVAAGLADTLAGPGPFTVFAPTNAAFAALLAELGVTAPQLLADKALLTKVLTYHVLPGRVLAADIREGAQPATVQGQSFTLGLSGGPSITDANGRRAAIVATDVQAANGVIHVIDKVLLPKADAPPPPPAAPNIVQVAQGLSDFSVLVEAVVAADLADTLAAPGPYTVFAPTNAAFAAMLGELGVTKEQLFANKPLLTAVLTYHVLPRKVLAADLRDGALADTVQGQAVTVDLTGGASLTDAQGRRAAIVATDVAASNGVIHAIDRVILPQTKDIVELALGLPDLSILVEAVLAADLQGVLAGPGPFTVFAPTNAAFAALLHELGVTKAQLLADKPLLSAVLTYHVLPARVLARDVAAGASKATTVQGQKFTLNKAGTSLHIVDARHRGAHVIATDVQAANGVVHVIDRVLLPKP